MKRGAHPAFGGQVQFFAQGLAKFFLRVSEGFFPYGPLMGHAWVTNGQFGLYKDIDRAREAILTRRPQSPLETSVP